MAERLRWSGPRLRDGESTSAACRQLCTSRKTGYKSWGRYLEEGLKALSERSWQAMRDENANYVFAITLR